MSNNNSIAGRAALTFINAQVGKSALTSVRLVGRYIDSVGQPPAARDQVVDLQGDLLMPGLINSHDHLHLNSLPNSTFRARYLHVREWISDVNLRRASDPEFEAGVAIARDDRLLIGGLKNLLSGVTTVAHHDPLFPSLLDPCFPTNTLKNFGWSHSLYVDGEEKVSAAYRATPPSWPWIIHAGEGLDAASKAEFDRLDNLGCLGANTLLIHGVGFSRTQLARLSRASAGLIWCPSSNLRLFGQTAEVAELVAQGRVLLGTDSRMSGSRDLLDELRLVKQLGVVDEQALQSLVTRDSARLLRLADCGEIREGAQADILVLPAGSQLGSVGRRDVRLVVIAGEVRVGDRHYAEIADPDTAWKDISVDGSNKCLHPQIMAQLSRISCREPGVEIPHLQWRAA
jgi:cytosine/adenosine deaminase-related metal-dependent hydrolase